MPAVNPLLAIMAPASPSARTARSGFALQDLPGARAPENTGVRAEVNKADVTREPVTKPFARELKKGLEQQSEQRESRRSAREESARTADADRKEDAAARMEAGKTLPQDGRPLPAEPAQEKSLTAPAMLDVEAGYAELPLIIAPAVQPTVPMPAVQATVLLPSVVSPEPLIAAQRLTGLGHAADAASVALSTPMAFSVAGAPAPLQPNADTRLPQVVAAQHATTPTLASTLASPSEQGRQAVAIAEANGTRAATPNSGDSPQAFQPLAPDNSAIGAPSPDTGPLDGMTRASEQVDKQLVTQSTNPFAALTDATEAEPMQLARRQASTQLEADVRQAQSSAAALAQAQGSEPGTLLDLLPAQGDLAERVRAWRGLSAVDAMLSPSLMARSEAAGPSLFAQSSGQLQQFADSLRMALNLAEAPSLIPDAERNTSSSAATPAAAPGALSGAAAAAPADAGSAWRADNLQMPALNGGARPAAGTLQFLQTMQPSNFGAPLGETFGQNAWAESVTQRVALMTGLKLSSARIELDPPELGAMTVKVSVSGDQASVSFSSPHAIVRDALEQTFPRLQEMLGQQGLQLADAQVSDQSAERRQSGDAASGNRSAAEGNGDEGSESVAVQNVKVATSLIDYYA
jgi:flagellar hook-length control protein FliK